MTEWKFGDGSEAGTFGGPATGVGGSGLFLYFVEDPFSASNIQMTSDWMKQLDEPYCLSFYYNIYGPIPVNFQVRLFYRNSYTTIFARSGSQGNRWHQGHVTIHPQKETYRIVFYAFTPMYDKTRGHIGIDDFTVQSGECVTTPTHCDFESNTCAWTSEADDSYDFTFERIRKSDNSHSEETGGQKDRTTQTKYGYFMQIEAADQKEGEKAGLMSPPLPVPRGAITANCVNFWYHMYGTGIGSLIVNTYPTKVTRRVSFARSGNHGNHWWQAKVNVMTSDFTSSQQTGNYRVAIEAIRGETDLSDIGIDDILITNGTCDLPATCDFEHSQCGWSNLLEVGQFGWIRSNSATPSIFRGPSTDHTYGNETGYYMFIDDSVRANSGDFEQAYYASEIIPGSSTGHCFSFWYQMSGSQAGTLAIQLLYPAKEWDQNQTRWTKNGDHGDQWYQSTINIFSDGEDYSIVFTANMIGNLGKGNIAIDDLSLDLNGPCLDVTTPQPTPEPTMFLPCGFEQSNCGWHADSSSTTLYDWLVSSGSNLVASDAPLSDHTRSDQSGHYVSICKSELPFIF